MLKYLEISVLGLFIHTQHAKNKTVSLGTAEAALFF